MRKKLILPVLALLLLLAVNLKPCWRLTVNDTRLPGLFSSGQIREGLRLSALAAEEISNGPSSAPVLRKNLRLSFRPPDGEQQLLNSFLLLYSGGVELSDGVFVNGTQLGTVEDGNTLSAQLRDYIKNQMPNSAVFGSISGKLQIRPLFSRRGHETDYQDMILLVSGMAPVFYVDKSGHIV